MIFGGWQGISFSHEFCMDNHSAAVSIQNRAAIDAHRSSVGGAILITSRCSNPRQRPVRGRPFRGATLRARYQHRSRRTVDRSSVPAGDDSVGLRKSRSPDKRRRVLTFGMRLPLLQLSDEFYDPPVFREARVKLDLFFKLFWSICL